MTPKQTIEAAAVALGLTIEGEFIPWSKSRNAGEKMPSLNWRVTLLHHGKPILETDYMAGCGHCPSYRQGDNSVDGREDVKRECETGMRRGGRSAEPIKPVFADVLHSLVSDADALDCADFEEWASNYGYDTDSRQAESIYRQCLSIGLKLRNALGDDCLKQLGEACQDY